MLVYLPGAIETGCDIQTGGGGLLPVAQRWAQDHPRDYPQHFSFEVPR